MPGFRSIEMRMIRSSVPNPETDDILRITKIGDNLVRAVYTERSGDGSVIDIMKLSYHQLFAYIYRMFWLLSLDEDPFVSVQIFLPCYPTILLAVSSIQTHINQLMELLSTTIMAWPTRGEPCVARPSEGVTAAAAAAASEVAADD
jgi:hypothetical protein